MPVRTIAVIICSLFTVLRPSIKHILDKLCTIARVFDPLSAQHEAARLAAQQQMLFVEESLQSIDTEQASILDLIETRS